MPGATVVRPRVTEIPLSFAPKPTPVTVSWVPGAPRSALTEIAGVTVKGKSRAGAEPPDRMEYVPAGDAGMVTAAVQEPVALADTVVFAVPTVIVMLG